MLNHPDTRQAFLEMLKQPMSPGKSQTRWLFQKLKARWPAIREAWNAYITELEYGWTPEAGMLQVSAQHKLLSGSSAEISVATEESWQASGYYVLRGSKLRIRAVGSYQVAETLKPWISYADGVTLEYYRGQPLGRLMLAFAMPRNGVSKTETLSVLPLGTEVEVTAPLSGELQFRVNESPSRLQDNQGTLRVVVEVLP